MPTPTELARLAREIQAAQDEVRQIEPFTSRFADFDVSSAYAVADLVHRARVQQGAVPVGRKIGFTNPEMWDLYGVAEPIWGYVYDRTFAQVGQDPETCSVSRFAEVKIEPEVVLHFHTAPPPDADIEAILACVDWIALGFEVVQSHFPGWKFRAADTIADGGLHGMLLIGEPQPLDRLGSDLVTALERFSLSLSCDGVLREVGTGANVLGSPLRAIAHLNSVLAKSPAGTHLRAGELVTTGTITTAHTVNAGETWRMEVEGIGLPGVSVRFID
jgi:2-keto-4-pentenoate hydratase